MEKGRIALTERGRQAAAQALPIWEQAQKQITGALGDDRWDALLVELAATKATVRTNVSRHKR